MASITAVEREQFSRLSEIFQESSPGNPFSVRHIRGQTNENEKDLQRKFLEPVIVRNKISGEGCLDETHPCKHSHGSEL